jgi:hypothetical protein
MNIKLKNLRILWDDRTVRTIVFAVVLITVMGSLQPDTNHGLFPDEYWARKGSWGSCADVVLAGDSRVLIGLSPAEMSKILGPKRIYNFGFGGGWYSPEYLQAVEDLLDPAGDSKMIILGISPHSLTKRDPETGDFFEIHRLSEQDRFMNTHFARLTYFFEPRSFNDAMVALFPSHAQTRTHRTFCADGWISVHKEPCSISQSIKKYHGFYQKRIADEWNIANIMKAVSEWVCEGISVYGFLPPSCKEMYELEVKVSGFDQADFIARFEKAGGIWIETDPCAYYSFDGSLLQDFSALEFTDDFTRRLLELEKADGRGAGIACGKK